MLTEREITKSWRELFNGGQYGEDAFIKAEGLIDELRPESPLRHRLWRELDELRRLRGHTGE